jgi:hypothetical protein
MAGGELEQIVTRLDALHAQVGKLQPARPWLERHAFLVAPMVTVVVFLLGFFLKDWVDQELRERQFRLSSAQAVQGHIQTLAAPGASGAERIAVAVALAEFGEVAVASLARHLRLREEASRGAAMEGLRTAGLIARERVCAELGYVLERDRLDYPWWSQASAAELLADLRCRDGAVVLARFAGAHLAAIRAAGTLSQSELASLERAVGEARERLGRPR